METVVIFINEFSSYLSYNTGWNCCAIAIVIRNKPFKTIDKLCISIFMNYCKALVSTTDHPKITKGSSKHEKQCDARNLLTKTSKSISDKPQTECSLSSSLVCLNNSSDEFDDGRSFLFFNEVQTATRSFFINLESLERYELSLRLEK